MRKKIRKIYAITLGIGLTYLLWGLTTGLYIPCLYYLTTGLLCPGCGTSRMFLALLRGNLALAFSYNPVVFVLLIVWNIIAILCCTEKISFVQDSRFLYTVFWLSIASLLIFCLIRNMI